MTCKTEAVVVSGGFDDIRSQNVRFLQEAAHFGALHIFLWNDNILQSLKAKAPKFPQDERFYFLQAIRYVHQVHLIHALPDVDTLPTVSNVHPAMWIDHESEHTQKKQAYCQAHGINYNVLKQQDLQGYPDNDINKSETESLRKKVLVTGCYDWFHSGHVRFFEEVSELGELYVVVGHDENIRELKGKGHPMFDQQQRRYMVQSIRYVRQALISTGHGWLDAEPEIEHIRPDIYAVNEDGDKPIKRRYCEEHGIEYVVLKRLPRAGLPKRVSTNLRGF
jgi:cytidyltransferase-like protein